MFVFLQADEEMTYAKGVYESINSELKEELPSLYDRSERVFSILCDLFELPVVFTYACFIYVFLLKPYRMLRERLLSRVKSTRDLLQGDAHSVLSSYIQTVHSVYCYETVLTVCSASFSSILICRT